MRFKKLIKILVFPLRKILEIVFPLNCIGCGKLQPWGGRCICEKCWEEYIYSEGIKNFQENLSRSIIEKKLNRFPGTNFNKVYCLGSYQFPLDDLVKKFKYHDYTNLAEIFAEQLGRLMETEIPRCKIVFIPMIPKLERDRGYNQTFLIAKCLALKISMDLVERGIKFRYKSKPQVDSSYNQRINQMKNTMALDKNHEQFKGQNIIVVDDVMTTGATLSEAYRVLKKGGANQIYAAVVAVAI